MTLVKTRAAFEKAVTDAVTDVDPTVSMVYDNVTFTTSGKTKKYVMMMVNYTQSTLQNQRASSDYYTRCLFNVIFTFQKVKEQKIYPL